MPFAEPFIINQSLNQFKFKYSLLDQIINHRAHDTNFVAGQTMIDMATKQPSSLVLIDSATIKRPWGRRPGSWNQHTIATNKMTINQFSFWITYCIIPVEIFLWKNGMGRVRLSHQSLISCSKTNYCLLLLIHFSLLFLFCEPDPKSHLQLRRSLSQSDQREELQFFMVINRRALCERCSTR